MRNKEIMIVLVAINSTGRNLFKYPIGNADLSEKLKTLEAKGKIKFDDYSGLWKKCGAK